jgi:hypothetical protein
MAFWRIKETKKRHAEKLVGGQGDEVELLATGSMP